MYEDNSVTNGRAIHNGNGYIPEPVLKSEWTGNDELSLRDVIEIILRGKWVILASIVCIFAITGIYTFTRAPEYETSSLIRIDVPQSTPPFEELLGMQFQNRDVATEAEILKSRTIAGRVADRLLSMDSPSGERQVLTILQRNGEDGPPITKESIIGRLRGSYTKVSSVGPDVNLLRVTGVSTNPEEAAIIANLVAEEYVSYNRGHSRARVRASREFLSEVTERFQTELESAEQDLAIYLDQARVVAPDEEARKLLEQVMELQKLQYETQYELGMASAERSALEQEVAQIVPGLAEEISSGNDLIVDQLIAQIAELELAVERKYARNPALRNDPSADRELVRRLEEIEALELELQQRADRMVAAAVQGAGVNLADDLSLGGSSRERLRTLQVLRKQMTEKDVQMRGLEARLDVVNERLAEAKKQLSAIPGKEIILNRLERSLTTRERLYMALVEKLQEARIAEQSELGYVDIIDKAPVPGTPVRPRVPKNLLFGLMLGVVLGVGLAFARHALDHKIRTPEDLREVGLTVLAAVPDFQEDNKKHFEGADYISVDGQRLSTTLVTHLRPLSPIGESYRQLHANVRYSNPDRQVRQVLITSPAMGDGKTTTAVNLAISSAQSGRRTLYVDADLRRPAGHDLTGVTRVPGLVDALFDVDALNIDQFKSKMDDLYVIPAGSKIPNPIEILESRRLRNLFARLRDDFDMIVVDSPPVLAVADALSLSMYCDVTILVCSAGESTDPMLERSMESFQKIGTKISGVVLNRFNARAAYGSYKYGYGYGYGYGYDYGYGYGYSDTEDKGRGSSSTNGSIGNRRSA